MCNLEIINCLWVPLIQYGECKNTGRTAIQLGGFFSGCDGVRLHRNSRLYCIAREIARPREGWGVKSYEEQIQDARRVSLQRSWNGNGYRGASKLLMQAKRNKA